MPVQSLDITQFLESSKSFPVFDVRSPAEYNHAHIPGAYSLPLFTDEERKVVGTAYKQESREQAIKIGLDYFGPKMRQMVEQVESQLIHQSDKTVLVHCWRGGMRSGAVAWLLDVYGFKVFTLKGGYKSFRNWVLEFLAQPFPFKVLGGFTGSGKTEILHALERLGDTVIDLEKVAGHRGSAFGNLGLPPQTSIEDFENRLAMELKSAVEKINNKQQNYIWIEDESQRIGDVNVPVPFYENLKQCPLIFLEIPFELRLNHIIEQYGGFEKARLKNSIERIHKRLGGLETKNALTLLEEGNIRACFKILLTYYDRFYKKSSKTEKQTITNMVFDINTVDTIAQSLSDHGKK